MQVVSVNVGMPREVPWKGTLVTTGIFKDPVPGRIALRQFNLDGDGQADLTVHGGRDKAIYAYPAEHYAPWEAKLGRTLAPGAFGENLTTAGLTEDRVHIGDEFRIGTARLVVSQPRMPCFKLGIRFGDAALVKTFLEAGWPGIYFAVVEEGTVAAGDPIEQLHVDPRAVTVQQMLALIRDRHAPRDELRRVLEVPALAAVWREGFQARLDG
ncbi:MAG: MOSC domain-containing protein [Planctomycetaceae bacterium]|nr:MOSC domain-containing protein [Planctomycetaceae bacterium]